LPSSGILEFTNWISLFCALPKPISLASIKQVDKKLALAALKSNRAE
jgi:hypothetical protein